MWKQLFGARDRTAYMLTHASYDPSVEEQPLTRDGQIEVKRAARTFQDNNLLGRMVVFSSTEPRFVNTAQALVERTGSPYDQPYVSDVLDRAGRNPYAVRSLLRLVKHLMQEAKIVEPQAQPVLVTDEHLITKFAANVDVRPIEPGMVVSNDMRNWRPEPNSEWDEWRILPELSYGPPR